MPNSDKKIDFIDLLEQMYVYKDLHKNDKINWEEDFFKNRNLSVQDMQVRASGLLIQARLTAHAKEDALNHDIDTNSYRNILLKLSNTNARSLLDEALKEYERSKITTEVLIKNKNVSGLAKKYSKIGFRSEMLLVNPGETYTEYDDNANEYEVTNKTTFLHAMFEAGCDKEEIIDYMLHIHKLMHNNQEMFNNYLSLTNGDGKTIIDILMAHNDLPRYKGVYDIVASKCFTKESAYQVVDTHTQSIHKSVDRSLIRISQKFFAQKTKIVDGDTIKVTDEFAWNNEIDSLLNSLAHEMDQHKFNKKDKLKVKVSRDFVQKIIDKNNFGDVFVINPDQKQMLGLSLREVVAISYKAYLERSYWNNQPQRSNQFEAFVESFYTAKRGYNIDEYGEDELTHHSSSSSSDRNKCMGGIINEIVTSLRDCKLVDIKVIDATTVEPILKNRLFAVMKNIDNKDDVFSWFRTGIISKDLEKRLVEEFEKDSEIQKTLSTDDIRKYAPSILKQIDKKFLQERGKRYFSAVDKTEDNEFSFQDIYKFNFDANRGYELSVQTLFHKDREEFKKVILKLCDIALDQKDFRSQKVNEAKTMLEVLLQSTDKEQSGLIKEIITSTYDKLPIKTKIIHLIRSTEQNFEALSSTFIDCKVNLKFKDNLGNNLLYKAVTSQSKEIVQKLLSSDVFDLKESNAKGQTSMHAASFYENHEIFELLNKKADKDLINQKDADGKTSLFYAVQGKRVFNSLSLLKREDIDIYTKDNNGNNIFYFAVKAGEPEILVKLFKKAHSRAGKELTSKNKLNISALDMARQQNNPEIIKILQVYEDPTKALFDAVAKGDAKLVKYAIDLGGNVNATNEENMSLLKIAMSVKNHDMSEIILNIIKKGVDLEQYNSDAHRTRSRMRLPTKYQETRRNDSEELLELINGRSNNLESLFMSEMQNIVRAEKKKPISDALIERSVAVIMDSFDEKELKDDKRLHKKIKKEMMKAVAEQKTENAHNTSFFCCGTADINVKPYTSALVAKAVSIRKNTGNNRVR